MKEKWMNEERTKREADESIEIIDSSIVTYKDIQIAISGHPDGLLGKKTRDQSLLFCAEILSRAAGEGGLEELIQVPKALKETLVSNYDWSDIEYNEFVTIWRKNHYIMQIGDDNEVQVDVKEFNDFLSYLEKKRKGELNELPIGDTGAMLDDGDLQDGQARVVVDGDSVKVVSDDKDSLIKKVDKSSKKSVEE